MRKDNFWEQICFLTFLVFACTISLNAQYKIEVLDSNTFQLGEGVVLHKTSFRGLSVVNNQTIWVSGSRGTIARSIDGGKTFVYKQLKGYEKSDFRDIEAFDSKRAIVMSSGTPALILKTTDGGETWKEVFRQNDSVYFLDAMDFWDEKRGMLVGDPINNHFVLLQTNDGGETWQELDTGQTPLAMDGEAVFAASGTSLRCWGKKEYGFVTGGKTSNLILSSSENFNKIRPNTKSGTPSSGLFSIINHYDNIIGIGGDYVNEKTESYNYFLFNIETKELLRRNTCCYFSCIESLEKTLLITTGTTGVFIDDLGLKEFYTISSEPFHVVCKAKKGKAVFLAGPNGKIGKLMY